MIPITGVKHGTSFEACAATTKVKIVSPSTKFLLGLNKHLHVSSENIFSRLFHFSKENLYNKHTKKFSHHIWVYEEFLILQYNSFCSH